MAVGTAMSLEQVAAALVMGFLPPERLPDVAVLALESGHDSPSLCELAGHRGAAHPADLRALSPAVSSPLEREPVASSTSFTGSTIFFRREPVWASRSGALAWSGSTTATTISAARSQRSRRPPRSSLRVFSKSASASARLSPRSKSDRLGDSRLSDSFASLARRFSSGRSGAGARAGRTHGLRTRV